MTDKPSISYYVNEDQFNEDEAEAFVNFVDFIPSLGDEVYIRIHDGEIRHTRTITGVVIKRRVGHGIFKSGRSGAPHVGILLDKAKIHELE